MMFSLVLLAIMTLGVGSVVFFNFDRVMQIAVVVILVVAYVFWGGIYHWMRRDFQIRLFWEYLVVAATVGVTVGFLLWRG